MTVAKKPLPNELTDAMLVDYKTPEDLIGQGNLTASIRKICSEIILQTRFAFCNNEYGKNARNDDGAHGREPHSSDFAFQAGLGSSGC